MSKLDEAIVLATQAHAGQVDKGGQPYILHPLRVMLACKSEEEQIAAVLHDVVEDCGLDLHDLHKRFGGDVAMAVDALTRRVGETYPAFVERCSQNQIARVVKLADIADNSDLSRLGRPPTTKDLMRLERYENARLYLSAIRATQARPAERGGGVMDKREPYMPIAIGD